MTQSIFDITIYPEQQSVIVENAAAAAEAAGLEKENTKPTTDTTFDVDVDDDDDDDIVVNSSSQTITPTKSQQHDNDDNTTTTCGFYCGSTTAALHILSDFKRKQIIVPTTTTTKTTSPSPNNINALIYDDDENDDIIISDDDADDEPTPASDLTLPHRRIWIVTTAALPWRTGTAVNPLLRALYLSSHRPPGHVTLVIPWLERREDRLALYGSEYCFDDETEQEEYVRRYAREDCGMREGVEGLGILFYPARYRRGWGSIFPNVDICSLIPEEEADVAILEEPEHLNWLRAPSNDDKTTTTTPPSSSLSKKKTHQSCPKLNNNADQNNSTPCPHPSWTEKFNHVVGIIHTNYAHYAKQEGFLVGAAAGPFIDVMSTLVIRAYCHKVIKLSAVLPTFAPQKEVVCNVHGVRSEFIERRRSPTTTTTTATAPVYFIGKLIWAKGFDHMLKIQDLYRKRNGTFFPMDIYGGGPDEKAIKRAFHGMSTDDSPRMLSYLLDNNNKDNNDATIPTTSYDGDDEEKTFVLPQSRYELRRHPIPARFPGILDHATLPSTSHIFLNPSLSEVLCTTTAESLAMGKFVVIPHHPSNTFFYDFPNALVYHSLEQCVERLEWAMANRPTIMTLEEKNGLLRSLTWEAATERLLTAVIVTKREKRRRERLRVEEGERRIAWLHARMGFFGGGGRGGGGGGVKEEKKMEEEEEEEEGIVV